MNLGHLQARGKDLAVDPVFELEKQRDVPTKYSRQLWETTVDAMKEIAQIKHKRQAHHIKQRLKKGVVQRAKADAVTVKRHMALIRSPAANKPMKEEEKKEEEDVDMKEDVAELAARVIATAVKQKTKKTRITAKKQTRLMEMN